MDRSDASALADLQMHWDEAYVIGLDGNIWSARHLDSADELRAHTSMELRELIRSDYAFRQRSGLTARRPATAEEIDDDLDDTDFEDFDEELDDEELDDDEPDGTDPGDADGEDVESAPDVVTVAPVEVDFATIRGERMSI
jgi:hypothetical protein